MNTVSPTSRVRLLAGATTLAVLASVAATFALAASDERAACAPSGTSGTSGQTCSVRNAGSPAALATLPGAAGASRAGDAAGAMDALVAPDALPPFADDATLPPSRRAPRAGSEASFAAAFRQLAASAGGAPGVALAERAEDVFGPGHADAERVALLQALWESGSPQAADWFARTLREPAGPAVIGRDSLPEFALGYLTARAARDPAALALLADGVSDRGWPAVLRRRAALAVAGSGTGAQLQRLAGDVAAESDAVLLAEVGALLRQRGDEERWPPLDAAARAEAAEAITRAAVGASDADAGESACGGDPSCAP